MKGNPCFGAKGLFFVALWWARMHAWWIEVFCGQKTLKKVVFRCQMDNIKRVHQVKEPVMADF